jgi:hypothetical protein
MILLKKSLDIISISKAQFFTVWCQNSAPPLLFKKINAAATHQAGTTNYNTEFIPEKIFNQNISI